MIIFALTLVLFLVCSFTLDCSADDRTALFVRVVTCMFESSWSLDVVSSTCVQACVVVASRYSGANCLLWVCCLHYKFLHAIKVLASVHVFDDEGKQDAFASYVLSSMFVLT